MHLIVAHWEGALWATSRNHGYVNRTGTYGNLRVTRAGDLKWTGTGPNNKAHRTGLLGTRREGNIEINVSKTSILY